MSSPVEHAEERAALEELLVDLERDPAELVEAVRREREARMGTDAVARDLDRAELRFLAARASDPRYSDALRARVASARRASLKSEESSLRATPRLHAAALFDLAELRADFRIERMAAEADGVSALIEERIAAFDTVPDGLRQEARERYAALSTEEEDLELGHKVVLLEETKAVLDGLVARTGDRELKKLARRLGRATCDRKLALRIEHVLTRRGASWLENTSLFLLVAILVLLFIETSIALPADTLNWLMRIDAFICVFFIAEFVFKLCLAPAKGSWFLRNAITDLLPAIPAALWLVPTAPSTDDLVLLRALRLMRITQFARYVQALRPILRLYLLVLFLLRSMDSLVERFSQILNRNFVFFERAVLPLKAEDYRDERATLFQALRREHVLLADLDVEQAQPILLARAERLEARLAAAGAVRLDTDAARVGITGRDIPVEHAIEYLYRIRPDELGLWMPRNDILALDRLVRVANAPVIRSLPIIRWFRSPERYGTPEERVVDLGKRIAQLFERWRERVLHVADMHGIVTGPQLLDRVASTLVKWSKRPAVRLLLFGALFWIAQLVLGSESQLGHLLERFVAGPLVVLGSVCLIFLGVGWWLKLLAGEASDKFKLTSEANFIGLLELQKRHHQDEDLEFLGRRVFRWEMDPWQAAGVLAQTVRTARTGRTPGGVEAPEGLEDDIYRVSLLYLHFLDGAVLHQNDIKTTEQLLANLSLENIRTTHLGITRRESRRLKKLSLTDGSMFRGPYVWFRFITESAAVESAKRVTDYNRHCMTLTQRQIATPERRLAFAKWLRRRRRADSGRLEKVDASGARSARGRAFQTTEFNALDFLSADPHRDAHVERVFGRHVLGLVRRDRACMFREIFGTRPLHELPRSERSLNFYQFYRAHLSGGRVLLAPWFLFRMLVRGASMSISKIVRIVQEILAPELAAESRERGRAPFSVALRKIHRMKAPTLVEAMRLRVAFDPAYCGAPPGWTASRNFEEVSELERDLDFLMMRERDRDPLRELAHRNRRRIEELHHLVHRLSGSIPAESDPDLRRRGERSVTIAYMTNRDRIRTLFRAEQWLESAIARMEDRELRLPARRVRRFFAWVLRGFRAHPTDRWLRTRLSERKVSRRGRGNFRRAWSGGDEELRQTVRAWLDLPAGASLFDHALAIAQRLYHARDETSRELVALRAIQSMSVLDVRNYRELVFDVGGYANDGEERELAEALP